MKWIFRNAKSPGPEVEINYPEEFLLPSLSAKDYAQIHNSPEIENSISGINNAMANHLQFEALKLKKKQIKLWATLGDCAIFGRPLKKLFWGSRYEKAWSTKQYKDTHKQNQKSTTNILANKKIKKALAEINKAKYGSISGDW